MYVYPGEFVDLGYGRGWLDRKPANSIFRIDRQIGHPIQITEAGRTWGRQNEWYQKYLRDGYPIALSPNTPSVHQEGGAVDSDEAQRILAIMHDHGWRRTVYRWIDGVWTLVEEWHFEHFEHLDNHRYEGVPAGAGGEDDMPTVKEIAQGVWHGITFRNGRTPAQELVRMAYRVDRLYMQQPGARFFKHGDMPDDSPLWIYFYPNGDLARIRDLATAQLYKELNGGRQAEEVSGAALREAVEKTVLAGGRDLTAVGEAIEETPEDAKAIPSGLDDLAE
tara:strand:+ start:823 stop:1656 length:834 start_codon:yes stop_codon:yes gene_type:complete